MKVYILAYGRGSYIRKEYKLKPNDYFIEKSESYDGLECENVFYKVESNSLYIETYLNQDIEWYVKKGFEIVSFENL